MGAITTRERIVEQADRLFYEQGFETTSFADIADAVGISRGNFYHHFKSKDAILDAVIARRLATTRTMLDAWQAAGDDPAGRVRCFIRILIANQAKIMLHGCPVGTLVTELAKLNHPAQAQANALFTMFHDWLAEQFRRLGREADATELAMHLLARSQGVATLASAFRDKAFIAAEVEDMCAWLDAQARHHATG